MSGSFKLHATDNEQSKFTPFWRSFSFVAASEKAIFQNKSHKWFQIIAVMIHNERSNNLGNLSLRGVTELLSSTYRSYLRSCRNVVAVYLKRITVVPR